MSKAKGTASKFVLASFAADRATVWPCKLQVPQDGGTTVEQLVDARFKVLAPEEQAAISNPLNLPGADSDVEILKKVLVGFDALKDEKGQPVADDAALALMFKLPWAVRGLVRGYMEMASGRVAGN